jgi:hypothetical protein
MDTIYKIGGARLEYRFPRNIIIRLRRQRGLFSVGLRIKHTQVSLPEFIVFWAALSR